jgi:protein-S-isoprenylcysteine O-methyltransferase Ste14
LELPSLGTIIGMEGVMVPLWKVFVFGISSVGIIWLSRRSLLDPRSHGFYRFFAWELILALTLLNLDFWFSAPFSWYQIISWATLMVSIYLIVHGVIAFRRAGAHDGREENPALIGIEKTTRLVTAGPYRYIRHPFYSSLMFLAVGVFFKQPSWIGAVLAGLAVLMLVITARIEEGENIRYFGEEYRRYMQVTRMFVPFLF